MKLSSFFVAAMVITSVNAGRFGKLWKKVKSRRVTRPSVTSSLEQSPVPDLMSDAVQRQMKDYPIIKNALNNDEDHNDMLIFMYTSKEEIYQLANEIEQKCFKYIDNTEGEDDTTQTKFIKSFNPDNIDYQDVMKLVGKIDILFRGFILLESEYTKQYSYLPNDASILNSGDIQEIVESIKDELKSII
ncbi:hypothetical protein BASA83_006985 [Batrachochytrium salamandrivorans]|nr:hypothetical protein BASA62_006388 [Batrachochytrium salamandrivorans]KAH9250465.1 hypothetical protein BASA81_011751 [Batrachochytrium salamandrivorans]KAH9270833.1 hypothetical protein BASA83_006985 [Batrachochytrium salamandrivorans]